MDQVAEVGKSLLRYELFDGLRGPVAAGLGEDTVPGDGDPGTVVPVEDGVVEVGQSPRHEDRARLDAGVLGRALWVSSLGVQSQVEDSIESPVPEVARLNPLAGFPLEGEEVPDEPLCGVSADDTPRIAPSVGDLLGAQDGRHREEEAHCDLQHCSSLTALVSLRSNVAIKANILGEGRRCKQKTQTDSLYLDVCLVVGAYVGVWPFWY